MLAPASVRSLLYMSCSRTHYLSAILGVPTPRTLLESWALAHTCAVLLRIISPFASAPVDDTKAHAYQSSRGKPTQPLQSCRRVSAISRSASWEHRAKQRVIGTGTRRSSRRADVDALEPVRGVGNRRYVTAVLYVTSQTRMGFWDYMVLNLDWVWGSPSQPQFPNETEPEHQCIPVFAIIFQGK